MVKRFYLPIGREFMAVKLSNHSILMGFLTGIKIEFLTFDRKKTEILLFSICWTSSVFFSSTAVVAISLYH
jgi:hypothetical protein